MCCEKLWESPASYPTQVPLSNSTINPGGIQSKQLSIVADDPPLKPGSLLQLAMLLLLAVFFSGTRLHAQTGLITGTVVDPSGAAIPGAHVQIINQATAALTRMVDRERRSTHSHLYAE